MKDGIKCLIAGLSLTVLTASSSYATITVNFNALDLSYLADEASPPTYLSGDLVEIGTFASAPTPGSPSLAGFSVFGTTLTGTGGSAGGFSGGTTAPAGAFAHTQIYLVAFNAPTASAATGEIIADVNDSINPAWRFPADTDVPSSTTFDLDTLFASPGTSAALAPGAQVIWGVTGLDPNGYSVLATIPEPSTYLLVGTGLLGLLAFRRRK